MFPNIQMTQGLQKGYMSSIKQGSGQQIAYILQSLYQGQSQMALDPGREHKGVNAEMYHDKVQ